MSWKFKETYLYSKEDDIKIALFQKRYERFQEELDNFAQDIHVIAFSINQLSYNIIPLLETVRRRR